MAKNDESCPRENVSEHLHQLYRNLVVSENLSVRVKRRLRTIVFTMQMRT